MKILIYYEKSTLLFSGIVEVPSLLDGSNKIK